MMMMMKDSDDVDVDVDDAIIAHLLTLIRLRFV